MTGERLDGPVEARDETCRDVLAWTLAQIADAIDETDRVRAPLATALVYGRAWMERTRPDDNDNSLGDQGDGS